MRRAPARPVRACFVRSCCSVAVQEHDLRATPVQCKHFPHTSLCTLHTPHSTLHTCTSSQLISSELFSSHSMSSHVSARFFLAIFTSSTSQYWCLLQKLAKTTSQYYFVLQSKHFPVLLCTTKLAQSTSQYYFVLQSLHKLLPSTTLYYKSLQKPVPSTTLYYKACTKHFPVLLSTTKLAQSTSQYYFVLQSLHKLLPSTTLYYKACTKHVPVLLCTTKLAQNTSQYYFLYYKACTNRFPVLLCTTKLAQSTSQYYFVLQSLHKALPSTTVYYKACTKRVPVLLCSTKLAQSTSKYYFVLQSLHKALPSTTLYYKACALHFPVVPRSESGNWRLVREMKHTKSTSAEPVSCCAWPIVALREKVLSEPQVKQQAVARWFLPPRRPHPSPLVLFLCPLCPFPLLFDVPSQFEFCWQADLSLLLCLALCCLLHLC